MDKKTENKIKIIILLFIPVFIIGIRGYYVSGTDNDQTHHAKKDGSKQKKKHKQQNIYKRKHRLQKELRNKLDQRHPDFRPKIITDNIRIVEYKKYSIEINYTFGQHPHMPMYKIVSQLKYITKNTINVLQQDNYDPYINKTDIAVRGFMVKTTPTGRRKTMFLGQVIYGSETDSLKYIKPGSLF